MNRVVSKYPAAIRVGVLLVCALLAVGVVRDSVSSGTMVVALGALCLAVAVLSYRAEVDPAEVRVRYLPFYTKRTPISAVTRLVEKKTLVLVTTTSTIPLWGLSLKGRKALFEILPRRLETLPAHPIRRTDSAAVVRRHLWWTVLTGVAFVIAAAAVTPFLAGLPLHPYWNSAGKFLLLLCMGCFIAFVFEAGFTWVLWSSKREFDRIERAGHSHRRS